MTIESSLDRIANALEGCLQQAIAQPAVAQPAVAQPAVAQPAGARQSAAVEAAVQQAAVQQAAAQQAAVQQAAAQQAAAAAATAVAVPLTLAEANARMVAKAGSLGPDAATRIGAVLQSFGATGLAQLPAASYSAVVDAVEAL